MKITEFQISINLPKEGLKKHLQLQLKRILLYYNNLQNSTTQFLSQMIDLLHSGNHLSPNRLEVTQKILRKIKLIDEVEIVIDTGTYGVFEHGTPGYRVLTFGLDTNLYNRIIGKGTIGRNENKTRRERDLEAFKQKNYSGGHIDPSLKTFFDGYAARYAGSGTAMVRHFSGERDVDWKVNNTVDRLRRKYQRAFENLELICTQMETPV